MPNRKNDRQTVYVYRKSNDPAHLLNHIPVAVNNRLTLFKETNRPYQEAIRASGYEQELNFIQK